MTSAFSDFILNTTEPEHLFKSPETAAEEYQFLMKEWHPDVNKNPLATKVCAQITSLYAAAKKKIAAGTWIRPDSIEFCHLDGRRFRLRYSKSHSFELGTMYYGQSRIAFFLSNDYADLFENAHKIIGSMYYRDGEMEEEIARWLPSSGNFFETNDGRCGLVLEKPDNFFLLRDVLEFCGGTIDPRHVAWIGSSLYNLLCYLEWSKTTHNDLSMDTILISPERHAGALLGGWWYAARLGHQLNALPARSHACASTAMLRDKKATHSLDLALAKLLLRELLGDSTGMSLTEPKPMIDFLRQPSTGSAVLDYEAWRNSVLPASFGARRFVVLDIKTSDIFKER